MDCLIIAAGQGTRLRARAPSKPLAEVCGVPLIERVVWSAAAGGATSFTVVTGYAAPAVEAFLAELSARAGVPIATLRTPDPTRPNGVSVLAAAERLTAEFLLLMADHLFDPDIVRLLRDTRPDGAALTLAVDRDVANPLIDLDDATKVASEGSRITRIGKEIAPYDAIDTGVFLATPALFDAIRADVAGGGPASLSGGVQRLADEGRAHVVPIEGRWWIDVDDPAALERAEHALRPA